QHIIEVVVPTKVTKITPLFSICRRRECAEQFGTERIRNILKHRSGASPAFSKTSPPPAIRILDWPVESRGPRRRLVADRHQSQRVGCMRRPVVLGAKADVARVVLSLVIEAECIATGLSGRLVEPELRSEPAQRLDPHYRSSPALVLHRRLDG